MFRTDPDRDSITSPSLSQSSTSSQPQNAPGWPDSRLAAHPHGETGPAQQLARLASARQVVVQLPAEGGLWGRAVVRNHLQAAWRPGIAVVVADLTSIVNWHDEWIDGLMRAQRDLASSRAELRLVVWSADLYAALLRSTTGQLSVFANLPAALRIP